MLKKDDRSQQMVYYQVSTPISDFEMDCFTEMDVLKAGIGTYTIPQIATPAYAKYSKTMDMAIAQNLDAHVMGEHITLLSLLTI